MFGVNQMLMQRMMQNNPNFQKAMDKLKECDNDPQKAFYKMAEEMGVNPEDVIKQAQSMMGMK